MSHQHFYFYISGSQYRNEVLQVSGFDGLWVRREGAGCEYGQKDRFHILRPGRILSVQRYIVMCTIGTMYMYEGCPRNTWKRL